MDLAAGVGRGGGRRHTAQFVAHLHARQRAVLRQHAAQRALDRLAAIVDRLGQVEDQMERLFLRPADLEIGGLSMPGLIVTRTLKSPLGHFRREGEIEGERARGRKRHLLPPQAAVARRPRTSTVSFLPGSTTKRSPSACRAAAGNVDRFAGKVDRAIGIDVDPVGQFASDRLALEPHGGRGHVPALGGGKDPQAFDVLGFGVALRSPLAEDFRFRTKAGGVFQRRMWIPLAEEAVVARLALGKDAAAVGKQQPDSGPRLAGRARSRRRSAPRRENSSPGSPGRSGSTRWWSPASDC